MQQIQEILGLLPIVRGLRADPNYSEWEAYDSLSEEDKKHRLTSGPLKGSRGLAVQVRPCCHVSVVDLARRISLTSVLK